MNFQRHSESMNSEHNILLEVLAAAAAAAAAEAADDDDNDDAAASAAADCALRFLDAYKYYNTQH